VLACNFAYLRFSLKLQPKNVIKSKTQYFCQNCGHASPKWMGRCPSCGEWNTFVEEITTTTQEKNEWRQSSSKQIANKARRIQDISYEAQYRIEIADRELRRVLGGGIVPGSLILIGGEPGIGKSTLMLQLALSLSKLRVLYVSGEESEQQIKMRAERLSVRSNNCFVLAETSTQNIFKQIEAIEPQLVIIDSIQTLHSPMLDSAAGSISQVRQCTAEVMKFAKETNTPVFLVGHITKEGSLAGPKVLEHMVDTVLQFEGDRHMTYRILRTIKNRFGSTSELGIYEMRADGLREVSNPSEILLSQREEELSGVAIGSTIEGNRPLLVEVQSLVSHATYGTPQRSSTGFDAKRLNMLLAVLEKRAGFRLGDQDVFLNIAGGLRVEDPAIDLAVCCSIASSYEESILPPTLCFAGEVGLGGEVRAITKIEQRIAEAEKLGFRSIITSKYNLKGLDLRKFNIEIHGVAQLDEVFRTLF
jgi:DNA repair protein RadA/Sms